MKGKIRLKTKLLLTFAGLTSALLIAVMLIFNLSIRGYINSSVNSRLESMNTAVEDERRGHGKPFDNRPDRFTGARGSAIVLSESGDIISVLHGDEDTAAVIAEKYRSGALTKGAYTTVSTEDGTFAVAVADDPVQKGSLLVSFLDITAISGLAARVNIVLMLLIAAAIVLCFVLSRFFARAISKPVQDLSDYARSIGEGDLEIRRMDFRELEFAGLADSMRDMAANLKEAKAGQEVFFQNVSHELRTPLTSIRGSAEGIVYGVMEPVEAGNTIIRETERLTAMVEDILYISRINKTEPAESAEPMDIRETLSLCASEQRAEAAKRGLHFEFDFDDAPALVRIRAKDAERIFGNLVSNAIRYAKSAISLSCHDTGEGITVRISDDGPGIPEKDLPHIFERFYKGEGGKHGIGLAIAREAAEAYHGSLEASNAPGAVFTASFPRAE